MKLLRSLATASVLLLTACTPVADQTMVVTVYFDNEVLNPGAADCGRVYGVHRTVPASADVLGASVRELLAGPTAEESAQGYRSWFSAATADALLGTSTVGDTSYVDLADVSSTIKYPKVGFRTREAIPRPTNDAYILTTPPFPIDGESPTAVSVHLRWVLSNDLFTSFVKKKGDPRKTLFVSFHADSLHPTARGTMVYVPGAASVPSSPPSQESLAAFTPSGAFTSAPIRKI